MSTGLHRVVTSVVITLATLLALALLLHSLVQRHLPRPVGCVQYAAVDGRGLPQCDDSDPAFVSAA